VREITFSAASGSGIAATSGCRRRHSRILQNRLCTPSVSCLQVVMAVDAKEGGWIRMLYDSLVVFNSPANLYESEVSLPRPFYSFSQVLNSLCVISGTIPHSQNLNLVCSTLQASSPPLVPPVVDSNKVVTINTTYISTHYPIHRLDPQMNHARQRPT